MEAQVVAIDQSFHSAYETFIEITDHLSAEMSCDKMHSEIEAYLETAGRELLRLLLQDHLDNQGSGRVGEAVCGSDGVARSHTARSLKNVDQPAAQEPSQATVKLGIARSHPRQCRGARQSSLSEDAKKCIPSPQ